MKKEWLLLVLAIGLVALLNGCCKKYICPDCSAVSAGSAGGYQAAMAPQSSGGSYGSYSGARAVK